MAAPHPPGWEEILEPQEQILWQGRPEARFEWSRLFNKDSLSGLFFTCFSLFWIFQAYTLTRAGPESGLVGFLFPLFGIPFLLVGLNKLIGTPWRAYERLRGSHYTLTDRHAFIATEVKGKRELERFSLSDGLKPALEDGSPGSVWFALRAARQSRWFGKGAGGAYGAEAVESERVGFQSITEARRVFRLMLDAQTALIQLLPPQHSAPPPIPNPPPAATTDA